MDLVPCDETSRDKLAASLFELTDSGAVNKKLTVYVAKTFAPNLLDIARRAIEQAQAGAKQAEEPTLAILNLLKPFHMFALLLGKSPQITSLMYNHFESCSFQPLPENIFHLNKENVVVYNKMGFSDEIVREILLSYLKYLTYDPKWFGTVWNWSELGRLVTLHENHQIRYLATVCLSIITRPTQVQHIQLMREVVAIENYPILIDIQIMNRHIFDNSFRPCVEPKHERALQYANAYGISKDGYNYCRETIAKVTNVLLIKRELKLTGEPKKLFLEECQNKIGRYVTVQALEDAISRISYSISINKPCIIRGPSGSGKTSILDHIAAHTNRIDPPDYVKVQIGDQIDSKLLIGSYVCTEIPGQFEWQPGPLTRAMAYGSWIVFEDIDSAPPDLAQVIHSVIENRNLSCVACCPIKLDSPHPDFRIMFTQRTTQSKSPEGLKLGLGFVERLCEIVDLPELDDTTIAQIIDTRFKLQPLTSTILQLYKSAKTSLKNCDIGRLPRAINMRDLFSFCQRVSKVHPQAEGSKISSTNLDLILLDAVDCFLASIPEKQLKKAAYELGALLNKPSNQVDQLLFRRKPDCREDDTVFNIGRVKLSRDISNSSTTRRSNLAHVRQSLQILERIALSLSCFEPTLLVGETGVGKTSIVQHLASIMNCELDVINLSQQSDSSDLLGGFKPVDMREIMRPLKQKFHETFSKTYNESANRRFLDTLENCFVNARKNHHWTEYLRLIIGFCPQPLSKPISNSLAKNWSELLYLAQRMYKRLNAEKETPMALAFSEGSLLRAVKEGKWILLDEINLAEPEVLQCLLLILDSYTERQVYLHNNSDEPVIIHPKFRVFACMNPATDIGKKDLDPGVRSRFTEYFVEDITDKHDLRLIIESYVKSCLPPNQIANLADLYLEIRARSSILSDISGNSPVYSLRTLCRALQICSFNVCRNMEKSLLESLRLTFLQQLNEVSIIQVMKLIEDIVLGPNSIDRLSKLPVRKPEADGHQYTDVEGFWLQISCIEPSNDPKYILTKSVKRNLTSLARIISLSQRRLPILIQGNTSVGKTSLILYLAQLTGNKCYRINNHEHTDLQEYLGRYVLKESGDLVFQEGLLVRAMKKGYWIILDELNLAPSELLEALNRALDDNRELFIPETRRTVQAHSKFVLFATQNPPEEYAGRKLLSRAFRNRFIELHFDEIPSDELEVILQEKCEMPSSYAKKIVSVMKELQLHRRESGCFNGKSSFMSIRDLMRWGGRYATYKAQFPDNEYHDWDNQLASDGLILLEGRVRTISEADTVKTVIEKVFKRSLNREEIYNREEFSVPTQFKHIHFSKEFRRLYVQLSTALKFQEPVLLCGQTGCGKTTACQLFAASKGQELITYNCHLNTESSDFVGSVRPSRDNDKQSFPWIDGPLVEAMKKGSIFLMDEISLADDAVLERINSVLEPIRSLTLTEKDGQQIIANSSFRLVATMNPGGDYGKKELSPALRNRFTEIYCHNTTDMDQVVRIIESSLAPHLLKPRICPRLLSVMQQFLKDYYIGQDIISLRDLLSWTKFLNKCTITQVRPLSIQEAIVNGASLVFFDQFGTCGHKIIHRKQDLKKSLKRMIHKKFGDSPIHCDPLLYSDTVVHSIVRFKKFHLQKGPLPIRADRFILEAPTVRMNILKIVRAMQLDRPILLEGDPGAGKTSIVSALARLTGHELVRINLSEQTDICDLFGSDLPDATSGINEVPKFCWHDGPILRAIKESKWILLDEMNLASQAVLEGLNACFDHRGEIFIPELNKKILVDKSTSRIFACQNPHSQGAARKGLPQSFINRFTSIYIESHSQEDLMVIIKQLHPNLPEDLIDNLVAFNEQVRALFKHSNFEFNLRDILYLCELMTRYVIGDSFPHHRPERFVQFVYLDRMRTNADRKLVSDLFKSIFNTNVYEPSLRDIKLGDYSFIMARAILPRKNRSVPGLQDLSILKFQMPYMESIAKAIEFQKMPIVVGETGVGKRSMVKILAGLTGNDLSIIAANREMDTVELLGSFEQKSLQREIVELVEECRVCVTAMINSIPAKKSAITWSQFFKHIWTTLYATAIRDFHLTKNDLIEALRFQVMQMKELIANIEPLSTIDTDKTCARLSARIKYIMDKFLYNSESMYSSGNFEWIDSVLIKSIKNGSWLMIENANLMNPATLDRLNSLVEPMGTLSLNEKGSGPDGIETLIPHPDFRLILTMNPEHGELSRAMRNRGVEICVQPRFFFEDFSILLFQNGFEPEEKKACMTYCVMQTCYDAHKKITGELPDEDVSGSLLAYFGLNYIPNLTHQIRRGMSIDSILVDLLVAFYSLRGYSDVATDQELRPFVYEKMGEYRKTYEVNLGDNRYKWMNFHHDLVAMTSGNAITSMVDRENRMFFEEFNLESVLSQDEMIEHVDIVNTCITVKIFLELSNFGDFEYRKGFIKETFLSFPSMMKIVNNQVELLHNEYIPFINSLQPKSELAPTSEMPVDSRNYPDIHHFLLSLNCQGTLNQEASQNRWLLSMHRIMLRLIVDLVEDRTMDTVGAKSLWMQSEQVKAGKLLKEDLIRPTAEIVSDLYDLLDGLLRVVSNRLFDNNLVAKMMARLFWISYFICKLRRGYCREELIAVSNQLPMLWVLTYQKVIVPTIEDCKLADLVHAGKKFSTRIAHICDFLETTVVKPNRLEKAYYRKVVNLIASRTKKCETMSRDVDKFFAALLGQYTMKSRSADNQDTLLASSFVWSNSSYLDSLYITEDKLLIVELLEETDTNAKTIELGILSDALRILEEKKKEYQKHEELIKREQFRAKCLNVSRRRTSLDQFAPIWQSTFIRLKLSKLSVDVQDPGQFRDDIRKTLKTINGLILSPRYYSTLIKCLQKLIEYRKLSDANNTSQDPCSTKSLRDDVDLYTTFLADHLIENVVFDNQVVGWTKLRVTTSDLSSMAPLIPEYSPINSLVASYCLDVTHLKLNSCQNALTQLEPILQYFWHSYAITKLNLDKDANDLKLVENLIHSRLNLGSKEELVGDYECPGQGKCACTETYIRRRVQFYDKIVEVLSKHLQVDDFNFIMKAIKMIYFGYLNLLEYAPIFSLDPSVRSREKLEVYKSELAHIKLDLYFRNTLYYWKTGENFNLEEIEPKDAESYPFSAKVLIERRAKLEKSIAKLQREHTNRPKSDDGSLYYELRKDVEVNINRCTTNLQTLMNDLLDYTKQPAKGKFNNLISKTRMLIKSFERNIIRLRADYSLYSDLLTNFLVGLCFVQQGLRCLYSRLEQQMQVLEYGFSCSVEQFSETIMTVFSFSNLGQRNLESVCNKLEFFSKFDKICPPDNASRVQSILLRTVLVQLNHHISITPSDIKRCIPIVRNIADLFHVAWVRRKNYMEEQRKLREDLYQYKESKTTVGSTLSLERQEFLDICAKFPTYDHVYASHFSIDLTSTDKENLETEEKICNLNRSVDLSMCIDICKAHYEFMSEASRNLLGQIGSRDQRSMPKIDLDKIVDLEAETLYSIVRHCIPTLDQTFDSRSIECHILQANKLHKAIQKTQVDCQEVEIKNSIDILDENHFDIYHHPNAHEALKFQGFIHKLDEKINFIRDLEARDYDSHPIILELLRLITRISSFLITEPLMKFVTGAQTIIEKIDSWNQQSIPKEDKMTAEADELITLIDSWRRIEIGSWKSSLHRVKRKYIDSSLCDLWFGLYQAFNDPIAQATRTLSEFSGDPTFELSIEQQELIYSGFALFIKNFLEQATLGDHQIRIDLVFSFTIQTRFASLYQQMASRSRTKPSENQVMTVDYEKLTTFVYNVYRAHQTFFSRWNGVIETKEKEFSRDLATETRIVSWQNRNLLDFKHNLRISHRKLNKVMNRYLEFLRQPASSMMQEKFIDRPSDRTVEDFSNHKDLSSIISTIKCNVDATSVPRTDDTPFKSFKNSSKIVRKLKILFHTASKTMNTKYVDNLDTIKQTMSDNSDAIINFNSHKVEEVTIEPKDSKEVKEEKHKLCRQMYHSKKFALQSVFKNLQNLGVSYQRGLNTEHQYDAQILSLEPLRGMIPTQSRKVLEAASNLVDDDVIISCNDLYAKLIAENTDLLTRTRAKTELSSDHVNRIRGLSMDMVLDIIKHKKYAALIYKDLVSVQAAATRLSQLKSSVGTGSSIHVYNFNRIHHVVKQFNELVGRAYLAVIKLEQVSTCQVSLPDNHLETRDDAAASEKDHIAQLIGEIGTGYSLLNKAQLEHVQAHLPTTKKSIADVSEILRDALNCAITNYMYSDDDVENLRGLYSKFFAAFNQVIPQADDENSLNSQPGTFLGALKSLLNEAEEKLKPLLDAKILQDKNAIKFERQIEVGRLDIRLHKLIRRIKLAAQELYKEELDQNGASTHLSETAKRKLKPFNKIDCRHLKDLLHSSEVSKLAGHCFITLNRAEPSADIGQIVENLTPILYIYCQDVASYLNIILSSLHIKLRATNQLILFFIQLASTGFGLPNKLLEEMGDEGNQTSGKSSEDNAGFGDGQGETDVSKKLEFESQLDDLKKNDDEKGDKKDEEENIEAHDDGIEMSDDIDAKAQGPDEKEGQDDENKQAPEGDDEDDNQDEIDKLDKEMDSVDQDEGQLDENIWDDKDEPPEGEDDGEDLREAEVDQSTDPNKDQTDMQAKNEELTDSKGDKKSEDDRAVPKPDDKEEINDKVPKGEDKSTNELEDEEMADNGLDLSEEAAQALKDQQETTKEQEAEPAEEVADMSISDDEADKTESEDKVESGNVENEKEMDNEADEDESCQIPDDLIDQELEKPLQPTPPEFENPLTKAMQNLAPEKQESGREMQGTKTGSHMTYEIIPEEKDEPLDFDDAQEQEQPSQAEAGQSDQTSAAARTASSGSKSKPEDEHTEGTDSAQLGQQDVDEESQAKTPTKRTAADRDPSEAIETKRRKIDQAEENPEETAQSDQQPQGEKNDADKVRHVEKTSSKTFEVIDLTLDDDDCLEVEPEQIDKGAEPELKPKSDQQANVKEGGKSIQANTEPLEVEKPAEKEVVEIDEEEASRQQDSADPNDDNTSFSSISSFGEVDISRTMTSNFPDKGDTTNLFSANLGLLKDISLRDQQADKIDNKALMEQIDEVLNSKPTSGEHDSLSADRLTSLWIDCTRSTSQLVHELCQQLQIVLQPTKMSSYKGDYKSGKRLNMRKIISYIASQYRKDKIWLRRTKPTKRTYNICLAVDNSKSMSENNCRQMTYQSLALLAKSLSLVEAGSLSVLSFGEQVRCIHEFGQPYFDAIGAQWLRNLRFNESQTLYKQLLMYSCDSFAKQTQATQSSLDMQTSVHQLLIILSDGRNVNRDRVELQTYLRQLKSMRVLTLFIIIDDTKLNGGQSLVDTKRLNHLHQIINYMEDFPFPFYVLLRQLETMPSVLGDALRQWFELVSCY